jgi:fructose-1,6-bisphosphatase I
MTADRTRLDAHIAALEVPEGLKTVLTVAAATCADISTLVAGGGVHVRVVVSANDQS